MRIARCSTLFLFLFLLKSAPSVADTTIQVPAAGGTGVQFLGTTYTLDGFTFTSSDGGFGNALAIWETGSVNHPPQSCSLVLSSCGDLLEYYASSTTTMTQAGNAPFNLDNIGLAEYASDQNGGTGSFSVTFTGIRADNSTVTQTVNVVNTTSPVLQHFVLNGFDNVVSVQFQQGVFAQGTAYQFGDFSVSESSPVPEPASVLLLGTGLVGGIGATRRKFPK